MENFTVTEESGSKYSNEEYELIENFGEVMNLFEFFLKVNSLNKKAWIETTATFTGKRNKAAVRTKTGYREQDYYEYEITYFAGDIKERGFYSFYPILDPEIEEIKGKTMKIKYNKKKPYQFEKSNDSNDM